MSLHCSAFTHMHLQAARMMPRKTHPVLSGDRAEKYQKQAKRERNQIAKYYRLIRSGTLEGYGREQASIAHRYGIVISASEARTRIKSFSNETADT